MSQPPSPQTRYHGNPQQARPGPNGATCRMVEGHALTATELCHRLPWYRLTHTELDCLQAICDHRPDGAQAFASIPRLAAYARVHTRTMQRVLHGYWRHVPHRKKRRWVPGLIERGIVVQLDAGSTRLHVAATYAIDEDAAAALGMHPRMRTYAELDRHRRIRREQRNGTLVAHGHQPGGLGPLPGGPVSPPGGPRPPDLLPKQSVPSSPSQEDVAAAIRSRITHALSLTRDQERGLSTSELKRYVANRTHDLAPHRRRPGVAAELQRLASLLTTRNGDHDR